MLIFIRLRCTIESLHFDFLKNFIIVFGRQITYKEEMKYQELDCNYDYSSGLTMEGLHVGFPKNVNIISWPLICIFGAMSVPETRLQMNAVEKNSD